MPHSFRWTRLAWSCLVPLVLVYGAQSMAAANPSRPQADMQWIDGVSKQQMGWNCVFSYVEPVLVSYVGYYGTTDGSFPRIGERYRMHIVVGKVGSGCGNAAVTTEALLPAASALAIDANNPVRCWAEGPFSNDQRVDVTNDKAWDCVQQPGRGPFTEHGYNFGTRIFTRGTIFEIEIPLVSLKPLSNNGICSSQSPNIMGGFIYASVTDPTEVIAYQCAWVADKVPSVDYPPHSATNVTGTTAWTAGNINSHYRAGKVYFDLGPTTSYGRSSDPIAISEQNFSYPDVAFQWTGLIPQTTYHWRLRFVTSDGTVYAGADQTFTTLAGISTAIPSATSTVRPTMITTVTPTSTSTRDPGSGSTPEPPTTTVVAPALYTSYLPYVQR